MILLSLFFYRMPRIKSNVWKHFTAINKSGKTVYLCKYCSAQYTRNATKQTAHLKKCLVEKRSNANHNTSSDEFAKASSHSQQDVIEQSQPSTSTNEISKGSVRGFFDRIDTDTKQKLDESLARAIYASGSPLMSTTNVYWKHF